MCMSPPTAGFTPVLALLRTPSSFCSLPSFWCFFCPLQVLHTYLRSIRTAYCVLRTEYIFVCCCCVGSDCVAGVGVSRETPGGRAKRRLFYGCFLEFPPRPLIPTARPKPNMKFDRVINCLRSAECSVPPPSRKVVLSLVSCGGGWGGLSGAGREEARRTRCSTGRSALEWTARKEVYQGPTIQNGPLFPSGYEARKP